MNKKELNNNGFSLVELIIVIAIMAVLVGVLAPTYMQYVEKSKKSNDVSTIDSIVSAIEVVAVDPECTSLFSGLGTTGMTITVSKSSGLQIDYTDVATKPELKNALLKIVPSESCKLKATWNSTEANNKIEFTASASADGAVTFKYKSGSNGNSDFIKYATTLTKIKE